MIDAVLKVSFFYTLKRWALWPACLISALCLSIGFTLVFYQAPLDYQQKETVRILYIHVPSAWLGLMIYGFMGLCAIAGFIWRQSLAFVYARAAAPIGFAFTIMALLTGAIWGKPMWGTWWVWDARLTSMLILGFMYGGYMLFVQAFASQETATRTGAFLLILGLVNLPIIKYSVDWWSTLHQPASVFKAGGATIHESMLWPLGFSAIGLLCLAFSLGLLRVETLLVTQKIRRLILLKARQESVR
jgi:heme exporter protein C